MNYKKYNDLQNEGGEGYNPYNNKISDILKKDAARKAKYGRLSCPSCRETYRVDYDLVCEDHVCAPQMTPEQMYAL